MCYSATSFLPGPSKFKEMHLSIKSNILLIKTFQSF